MSFEKRLLDVQIFNIYFSSNIFSSYLKIVQLTFDLINRKKIYLKKKKKKKKTKKEVWKMKKHHFKVL